MKRTAISRPPMDHGRDRARWHRLIDQAHQAVADDTPVARRELAAAGLSARNVWNPPAPYPAGLLATGFAHLAYAWATQTDGALRDAAREALIASAAMADLVLSAPVLVGPDLSSTPDLTVARPALRLPYADH